MNVEVISHKSFSIIWQKVSSYLTANTATKMKIAAMRVFIILNLINKAKNGNG